MRVFSSTFEKCEEKKSQHLLMWFCWMKNTLSGFPPDLLVLFSLPKVSSSYSYKSKHLVQFDSPGQTQSSTSQLFLPTNKLQLMGKLIFPYCLYHHLSLLFSYSLFLFPLCFTESSFPFVSLSQTISLSNFKSRKFWFWLR